MAGGLKRAICVQSQYRGKFGSFKKFVARRRHLIDLNQRSISGPASRFAVAAWMTGCSQLLVHISMHGTVACQVRKHADLQ